MIEFIGSGLFIGGLLGARFSVLALIPASALAITAAALAWSGDFAGANWTALDVLGLLAFLQIGYLCGAGFRVLVCPVWTMPRRNTKVGKVSVSADHPPALG
jgi:hypothetical protein